MLGRQHQIRFELKDREQGAEIEALNLPNVRCERVDELTYTLNFDLEEYTSGDLIRRVVAAAAGCEEHPRSPAARRLIIRLDLALA
jgi:hypothetical protein